MTTQATVRAGLLLQSGNLFENTQPASFTAVVTGSFGPTPDPLRPSLRIRMHSMFGNVHVTDDPARWSPSVLPQGQPSS